MDKIPFVFLSFFLFYLVYSAGVSSASSTMAIANRSIGNATSYLQMVNESGYLFFYPKNLSTAYSYLNKSDSAYSNNSPALAIKYSDEAIAAARGSYSKLNYYRNASLIAMLIFTVIVGFFLYIHMKPVKPSSLKRRKR